METTMNLTDLLKTDYRNVLTKLDDMERVIGILTEPKTVLADLERLGDFFRQDIWYLIWKEEDVLFPEIIRADPQKSGPTKHVFVDYKNLRELNERFQNGVNGYLKEPGNENDIALLCASGHQIVALLQDHIKEQGSVLQRAAIHLDQAQNRKIIKMFETIDADLDWCFEQLQDFCP